MNIHEYCKICVPGLNINLNSTSTLTSTQYGYDIKATQFCSDYETLETLAEIILENGINEPNFRYTGARLCDYLSLHLTVIIEGATLR